jgi:hypothetical protein
MPTPADQRLTDLLDRWLTSLDLHIKYSSLDDDSYWQVQPWVEHQRPARWILDLAREKTAALRAEIGARSAAGDAGFADALEQMMFLANLVGLQHIERFIPVAEPQNERSAPGAAAATATTATTAMSASSATTGSTGTREMPQLQTLSLAATGTREMPRLATPKAPPAPGQLVARAERKGGTQTRAAGAAKSPSRKAAAASDAGRRQVMNDAVRLLQWGRRWFELAELIARMADRPPPHEVRRILDENRAAIEASALDTRT